MWRSGLSLCLTSSLTSLLLVPNPAPGASPGVVQFTKILVMISPNEGCAVADVNQDGKPDVVAGTHWYAGPNFIPHPLRDLEEFQEDFYHNNGDHVWDVNGDGWIDVISGDWMTNEIYWYENPQAAALAKGMKWRRRLLGVGRGQNEAYFLRDLDGDGAPELIVDSWTDQSPVLAWKLTVNGAGDPGLKEFVLGGEGCGHGMAFGDVNGDGREDILCKIGWYERPAGDVFAAPWKLHADWTINHGSCPFVVRDLNQDGRNDLVWGFSHEYGLFWWEQLPPGENGATRWREHEIDRSWSQAHCLVWADLDGDGQDELITGKRVRGHAGRDPGGGEPACLYYYQWDPDSLSFSRRTISENEGVGTGMQIRTADLNQDGRVDIAVSGKSGTWILLNEGVR